MGLEGASHVLGRLWVWKYADTCEWRMGLGDHEEGIGLSIHRVNVLRTRNLVKISLMSFTSWEGTGSTDLRSDAHKISHLGKHETVF